jgi:signal peptidase II
MAARPASHAPREQILFIMMPVLLLGVLTDQVSKSWASLGAAEPRMLVPGYLAAYSVPNAGSILGFGNDQARTAPVLALLGILCAVLLARIGYLDRGRWRRTDCLACALLLAGIIGNIVDRVTLGHVRDFLVTWAIPTLIFNVADLLMVAGGAALLIARVCNRKQTGSDLGLIRCETA